MKICGLILLNCAVSFGFFGFMLPNSSRKIRKLFDPYNEEAIEHLSKFVKTAIYSLKRLKKTYLNISRLTSDELLSNDRREKLK